MGLNLNNLPEKEYYTFQEMADRWECDLETIFHFMNVTRILRPGMRTKTYRIGYLCKVEFDNQRSIIESRMLAKQLFSKLEHYDLDTQLFIESNLDNEIGAMAEEIDFDSLKNFIIDDSTIPLFLYQHHHGLIISRLRSSNDKKQSVDLYITANDLQGDTYLLIDPYGKTIKPIYPRMFDIIPREERDRFEEKYEMTRTHSAQNATSYIKKLNPYLSELQLRIDDLALKFPSWSANERVIQNTGNLIEWIQRETKSNSREAEIIKTALIEVFPELKKR